MQLSKTDELRRSIMITNLATDMQRLTDKEIAARAVGMLIEAKGLVNRWQLNLEILFEAHSRARAKDDEIARLEREVYVPGFWHCAKCNFTLVQRNLNAIDGTVTARDEPGDKCPNDGSPMWRVTWKQHAGEMEKRCEELFEERGSEHK